MTSVPGLGDPVVLGARTLPGRVLFGPHVTHLADPRAPRALGAEHVEHYRARAAGGAGVVVTEVASVVAADRPYEDAPLARDCAPGWAAVAAACRPHGTLVLAGIGHAGSQGSSAWSRTVLAAPSAVADPASREVPRPLDADGIAEVVAGFATAATAAVAAGCDGVEIAAGQHALLRQFLSGLTNHRDDAHGTDRALLLVEVLTAVRAAVPGAWVGLRLGVDELAPWAGITPEDGVATARRVADLVDHLVPVRGSALSVGATRPVGPTPAGVTATCAAVRAAVVGRSAVVLAGGVVDPAAARAVLDDGVADLVEMTRAQLADPALVAHVRAGRAPRPCVLTNQECRVRDPRNPRISCTVEPDPPIPAMALRGRPTSGSPHARPRDTPTVLVVGAGPTGLEGARSLARAGVPVRVVDRAECPGGLLRAVATLPGRERFARFADWLADEVVALGVTLELGVELPGELPDGPVLLATGALDADRPGVPIAAVIGGADLPPGPVVVDDPLGDGAAVALAERLAAAGRTVALVTPDPLAGKGLARTGDLVDANVRLQRAGVDRVRECAVVGHHGDHVVVADVVTGARRALPCAVLVDAGPRRPQPVPDRPGLVVAGDALAPRTVAEAVREGRTAAARLAALVGAS